MFNPVKHIYIYYKKKSLTKLRYMFRPIKVTFRQRYYKNM